MALLKRKRSGLSDPMSVVTNFVNACNRHDAEGVSACLHPEFDSIQPMYPSRNFRGADQVRRNWQAIFDAEPGFRLTVLRSAAAGDTVWLELHGAGRDAEVAGVFVMGVQGDRIRWARIYSALVEDAPAVSDEGTSGSPASLHEVPPLTADEEWGEGATAVTPLPAAAPLQEDLIAPVVDIDGNGRKRRSRSRARSEEAPAAPSSETAAEAGPAVAEASGPVAAADPVVEEAAAALEADPEVGPVEVLPHEVSPPAASPAVASVPAASPADSIDPERLIDAERLGEPASREGGGEPALEPEVIAEPSRPIVAGADYELEATGAPTPAANVDMTAPPPAPSPDSGETVETMVEVDPRVVVEPEPQIEAEPEIFVEMSIPEGAVDPNPQVLVKVAVPEESAEADAPVTSPVTAEPGLIVTTPSPAQDRAADAPDGPPPKRKKRKPR